MADDVEAAPVGEGIQVDHFGSPEKRRFRSSQVAGTKQAELLGAGQNDAKTSVGPFLRCGKDGEQPGTVVAGTRAAPLKPASGREDCGGQGDDCAGSRRGEGQRCSADQAPSRQQNQNDHRNHDNPDRDQASGHGLGLGLGVDVSDQPGGNRAIASDGDEICVVAESRSRYPGAHSDLPGQNLE